MSYPETDTTDDEHTVKFDKHCCVLAATNVLTLFIGFMMFHFL